MVQFTLAVVALLHAVLGLLVLRARRNNLVNQAFTAQSLVFAGWVFAISCLQTSENIQALYGFAFAFASLIPVAFLMFSHCYPNAHSWTSPLYVRVLFALAAVFMVLSLTTSLVVYEAQISPRGLSRKTGPLYPAFALYFIVTWCIALGIFVKKWRSARGLARAQFHYLGVGVVGGFVGGIAANLIFPLMTGQSTYSWLGPYFSLVYVGLVAHAIIRHRLLDLRLFVHRGLTVAIAIVLSALPVGLLLAVLWPRLLTSLAPSELGLLLISIAVTTILVPLTRDVSSRLLDRYVYRTQANYQRTVREASHMLTRVLHLETLLSFITATIVRSTAAEGVALYLRDDGVFR
jgi:hypothetical protein